MSGAVEDLDPGPLMAALEAVRALDPHVWYDLGPTLTCVEADALHDLLVALDMTGTATAFMFAHSREDDESDAHHGLSEDGRDAR